MILLGRENAQADLEAGRKVFRRDTEVKLQARIDSILKQFDEFENLLYESINYKSSDRKPKGYNTVPLEILPSIPSIREWLKKKPLDWQDPILDQVAVWGSWSCGSMKDGVAPKVALASRKSIQCEFSKDKSGAESLRPLALDIELWPYREALASALLDFHNAFLEARRNENSLSFADCEIETLNLIQNDQSTRDELRKKFQYVIVDEYQDINPLQQKLIYALCRQPDEPSTPPLNLYVVGDERQSIYGFRDADCRLIRELRSCDGTQNCTLSGNFRARPEILSLVNHVFREIWKGLGIHTDLHASFPGYAEIGADKPLPRIELNLVVTENTESGRRREARIIAHRLADILEKREISICEKKGESIAMRPVEPRDCAILLRTRATLNLYEDALSELGIPFRTESGGGFWDRREIADIRALLYCLSPIGDNLDWAILLRSPWVGLSDDALSEIAPMKNCDWSDAWRSCDFSIDDDRKKASAFAKWLDKLKPLAGRVSVARLLENALNWSGYAERVFAEDNGRSIRRISTA